jgi:nucleoside-diphosphate-sugar epimerase
MSSGNQLRQFHHTQDLVNFIDVILGEPMDSRFFDVCGQEYLTLREVAEGVLSHFGMGHLLRLGSLPGNAAEVFQPPNLGNGLEKSSFRPAISGLITTFHSLMTR